MPHPSLKAERSAAILQAHTKLMAHYGREGAAQDRIAGAAGAKRPILRHYLDNRGETVEPILRVQNPILIWIITSIWALFGIRAIVANLSWPLTQLQDSRDV